MRAPHQLHSERNDERRGGAPFVTFLTGAQIDPATGTNDGDVHVAYNLPSFDFDVCACALTPDADWAFLPTSLQTGGDEYVFDSDRFGTFKVHGTHAFVA